MYVVRKPKTFHAIHITPHNAANLLSVILTQPLPRKIRHRTRTVEIPIPRLRWQDAIRHPRLPIPLRRRLRRPRPVKPTPGTFITRHLRLRIHHEPRFVCIVVGRWVGVGGGAGAGVRFGRAMGGENGDGAIGGV